MKTIATPGPGAFGFLALITFSTLALPAPLRSQGDTPLIDTRSTSTGSVVGQEAMQNIPAARDPLAALSTLPGAPSGVPARTSVTASGDALITIDGVVIGNQGALGSPGTYVDYEHVEEIPVQTGGFSAEYGNSAGGVIQVVTKSGTTKWEGTGRYLVEGGDPNNLGSLMDPGIQIDIVQDATGGYCLNGFQVLDGGTPLPGGAGPIRFGFDNPFTIGVGSGSGTRFGAGATGSLNVSQVPACAGQPFGMSFVDATGPVTPANLTAFVPNLVGFDPTTGSLLPVAVEPVIKPGTLKLDPTTGGLMPVPSVPPVAASGGGPLMLGFDPTTGSLVPVAVEPVIKPGTLKLDPTTAGLMPVPSVPPVAASGGGPLMLGFDPATGSLLPVAVEPVIKPGTLKLDPTTGGLMPVPSVPPVAASGGGPLMLGFDPATGSLLPVAVEPVIKPGTLKLDPTTGGLMPVPSVPPVAASGGGPLMLGFDPTTGSLVPVAVEPVIKPGTLKLDPTTGGLMPVPSVPPVAASGGGPLMLGFDPATGSLLPVAVEPVIKPGTLKLDPTTGGLMPVPSVPPGAQYAGIKPSPLFSAASYRVPNVYELFANSPYTPGSIRSAPGARGVQDIGLEIDGQPLEEVEPAWLDNDRYAPGGAVRGDAIHYAMLKTLADELDSPLIYVVANGGPTGEVFRVQVVQPESGPVEIDGLVAVEPVAATAEDRARYERELAGTPGIKYAKTVAGYCLQIDALAPPAGTVYRVAGAEKQAAFEPMRRALDAARRLRDAGQLHPDSDPTDYFHSIRQWVVWSLEKGFDREGFLGAFVERMEKNFREAGQPWSAEVAEAVRSYGEGRWSDIREILDATEAAP